MSVLNLRGKGGSMYLEPGEHQVHIFDIKSNDRMETPAIDITYKNDQGQTIRDTFWTNEKSLWRVANLAIACGLAKDKDDPRLENFHTEDLLGCEVMIRVVKETSSRDGKEYSVVKTFHPVPAGTHGDKVKKLMNDLGHGKKSCPATEQEPPDMREPGEDRDEDPFA